MLEGKLSFLLSVTLLLGSNTAALAGGSTYNPFDPNEPDPRPEDGKARITVVSAIGSPFVDVKVTDKDKKEIDAIGWPKHEITVKTGSFGTGTDIYQLDINIPKEVQDTGSEQNPKFTKVYDYKASWNGSANFSPTNKTT